MAEAERHISREELFPFVHYEYGEAYYGSCGGTRYRLANRCRTCTLHLLTSGEKLF